MISIQVWKVFLPWGFVMRVGDSPLQETVAGGFPGRQKCLDCFDQTLIIRQEDEAYPGADYPLLLGQARYSQTPR